MHPGLKKIVFRKLNQDLSKVEIILSENQSIWFIDRANKYWYFELEKSGKLWWRYEFFTNFFPLFCLEIDEFQPLLSEWVEGIFNRGVSATGDLGMERITTVESILNHGYRKGSRKVDEVLNHKVTITEYCGIIPNYDLEEVLNREINELDGGELLDISTLEKVLNIEINETIGTTIRDPNQIIEMMNHQVVSISHANEQNELIQQILVNELIYEVESAAPLDTPAHDSVDEVLSYKVTRTIPDLNESLTEIDILLNQKL
jgi:hypothetical protein